MNTGKRNRRITILTGGTLTTDGIGGFTEGVKTSVTVWCEAKHLSMQETLSNGLETATAAYIFSFTYYDANSITRAKELTYNSRNFRIAQIKEIDEQKGEIQIIASERK